MSGIRGNILFGLAAACLLTVCPFGAEADEAVASAPQESEAVASAPVVTEEPATAPAARTNVVTAIRRAEQELRTRLAALKKDGMLTERFAAMPGEVEVTLAVWRRDTDTLRYLKVQKNGDDLTLLSGEKPLPRVTVSSRQNSQYEFADRSEIVVGALYPVTKAVALSKKKTVYDVTQTYVVPPGRDVSGPEVIAAGSDYLSGRIQAALDDLRKRGVKSVAFPDRLLADVSDPYLTKAIVIIEHSSHVALLSDYQPEKEMGDFLEYLGRRGDDAFDSSVSSAGASGMVQFIPSTYNLLVKNRPELGLTKDFKTGMADHHNALKAEIAYLDECLADMPRSVRDTVKSNPLSAAEVMAAAYNGGSVRVRRAIANWGLTEWTEHSTAAAATYEQQYKDWRYETNRLKKAADNASTKAKTNELLAQMYKAAAKRDAAAAKLSAVQAGSLRKETYWYVAKLRAVYQMLQGGCYATPAAPANALPVPATTTEATSDPDSALELAPATAAGNDLVICFDGDGC
jgi:hypothetical protein